jgi:hypothetical protein
MAPQGGPETPWARSLSADRVPVRCEGSGEQSEEGTGATPSGVTGVKGAGPVEDPDACCVCAVRLWTRMLTLMCQ